MVSLLQRPSDRWRARPNGAGGVKPGDYSRARRRSQARRAMLISERDWYLGRSSTDQYAGLHAGQLAGGRTAFQLAFERSQMKPSIRGRKSESSGTKVVTIITGNATKAISASAGATVLWIETLPIRHAI